MVVWELVRAVHILGAVLWVGGGIFALAMVMPAVQKAGPAGKGFMMATLRRGGWGVFFGPVGFVTILAGGALYAKGGYGSHPFSDLSTTLLTAGAALAVLAFVEGLAVAMPNERRMKRVVATLGSQGPTPEQGAELERLGMKQGKASVLSVALITLSLLLMVLRTAFA